MTCSKLSSTSSRRRSPIVPDDRVGELLALIRVRLERGGDGCGHGVGGLDRRQRDEPHAVVEVVDRRRPPTRRASRVLPMPPGPVSVTRRTSGRRSSPVRAATVSSRPTNAVGWSGRLFGRASSVAERRKAVRQVRVLDLEDVLGLEEVLEPAQPEVSQRHARPEPAADERRGRRRQQDLAAVPGRSQAGDAVHGGPEVVAVAELGPAGVDGHPDADRRVVAARAPAR